MTSELDRLREQQRDLMRQESDVQGRMAQTRGLQEVTTYLGRAYAPLGNLNPVLGVVALVFAEILNQSVESELDRLDEKLDELVKNMDENTAYGLLQKLMLLTPADKAEQKLRDDLALRFIDRLVTAGIRGEIERSSARDIYDHVSPHRGPRETRVA